MREALTVLLLALAAGLIYGTDGKRGHRRFALLDSDRRARAGRALALIALCLAIALWGEVEAGPGAYLIALIGVMVSGTLFALLTPLLRRKRPIVARHRAASKPSVKTRMTLDAWARIVAATVGTLPVALYAGAAMARFLPLPEDGRFAVALASLVPLWLALMCVTFLSRSGLLALGFCAASALALCTLVHCAPQNTTEAPAWNWQ